MSRLVILRHGNTFEVGEPPRRIGARTDLPLTGEGRAQAARAGRHFAAAGRRFAEIRTGPLARTRETAAIVAAAFPDPPPIVIDPGLIEIDHGPDEAQDEAAVVARVGRAALNAWDTALVPPSGWHVDADRRITWWQAQFAAAAGDRLFVTSNGAARFALAAHPALMDAPAAVASRKLRTGAWGEIDVDGAGATLLSWNVTPPA